MQANKPVAPLFFSVAALAGFIGVAYLGVHLWLWNRGALSIPPDYAGKKELHALIQIHLYFGLFILGFLVQAGPRVLGVAPLRLGVSRSLLIGVIAGVSLAIFYPHALLPKLILTVCFLTPLIKFLPALVSSFGLAFPICVSLLSLIIGAWLDLSIALHAIMVVWGTVGGAIFGAGQQFIAGPLRGERLSGVRGWVFALCFSLSLVSGFLSLVRLEAWPIFAWSSLASVIWFAYATRVARAVALFKSEALAPYLLIAELWAILGAASLLMGPHAADFGLHVLATGWGMTLIYGIGTRILGMVSGGPLISSRLLFWIVLVWQLVPIGRGFGDFLPRWTVWITATAAGLVYTVWIVLLVWGFVREERRRGRQKS